MRDNQCTHQAHLIVKFQCIPPAYGVWNQGSLVYDICSKTLGSQNLKPQTPMCHHDDPLLKNQHRRKMRVYPVKCATKQIYWHPLSWLLSMLPAAHVTAPSLSTQSPAVGHATSILHEPSNFDEPSWLAAFFCIVHVHGMLWLCH